MRALVALVTALACLAGTSVVASATEAYLFTGWLHVYSRGLRTIADQLPAAARVVGYEDANEIAGDIVARYRRGAVDGPIVLVGHSLGGNAVTRMANTLAANHVPVAYLGVLDAVEPYPIPDNVAVVDNFMSSCGWFSGRRLDLTHGFRGADSLFLRARTCHEGLDDDPAIQERIISMVTLIAYGFLPGNLGAEEPEIAARHTP